MSTDVGRERTFSTRSYSGMFDRAVIWFVIAAVGATAFFWNGLISLGVAWQLPEYSYGPLVPLITGYMTLRELHHQPVKPDNGSRIVGLIVLAASLLIGLIGNLAEIPDVITYGFILYLGALVLILVGTREGFRFWPGWLHLIFMLPLPQFIYLQVSTQLQLVSSEIGVWFIQLANIPVYLDGNVIDLGIYKLQVAEACSGLRYLFPLFSFGWLMAVLYNGPKWHKVVIFLATIPVTILMNSFRIGMIGVLVNEYGIEQAEGFLHFFEGWIIFISCTLILYVLALLLSRFAMFGKPRPDYIIWMDFEGVLGPLKKLPSVTAGRAFIAAAIVSVVLGAAWQFAPSPTAPHINRAPLGLFPLEIDGWKGRTSILDRATERVLGADDYLLADYVKGNDQVNLLMTFYRSQTQGEGIHSPEVCLPNGGWEVSKWQQKTLNVEANNQTIPINANRALISRGLERQLVFYWFEQRGRQISNDFEVKFVSMWDTITQGRSDGGLMRLVTPVRETESEAEAEERLITFLNEIYPMVPEYFPRLEDNQDKGT